MLVLIIGFGSIGRRHYEVLSQLERVKNIELVTKQSIDDKICHQSLSDVKDLMKYDYFVIASETNKHFEQLEFLEKNILNKTIFCEKPLFEANKELNIKNNKIFVAYVLRFHPLLERLRFLIKNEKIIFVNAKCGQYLPNWRPDMDYRKCYSAKKNEGGGVLLDLSHEIDYIQWICGEMNEIKSYQVKISDLQIDSDDLMMLVGKTNQNIFVNVSIEYISKIPHRKLLLETISNTYELDFIANKLITKSVDGSEKIFECNNFERNDMFSQMHMDIFNKQSKICTYYEAKKVMNTISMIQEQNV